MKKRILSLITAFFCLCSLALWGCTPSEEKPADPNPQETEGENTTGDPNRDKEDEGDDETEKEPPMPEIEYIEGREVISAEDVNSFDEEYVRLFGRTFTSGSLLYFANVGTGIEIIFYGTELSATARLSSNPMALIVFTDDASESTRVTVNKSDVYTFVSGLPEDTHTVRIVKATSSQNGQVGLGRFATDGKFLRRDCESGLAIEFVGDSITVGAGILAASPSEACSDSNTDTTKAYAYRTALALNADYSLVATEGICVKAKTALQRNMIEMYTTLSSTATGKYSFNKKYDIVVVALGTNDAWALSATYTAADFTADYAELLILIREKNPQAEIVCVYGMMNTNGNITAGIQQAINNVGDDRVRYLALPQGNLGAEGHPGPADAEKQADALTAYLQSIIGE